MNQSLKRYTELPFVLQALCTKKLTLLSPNTWDDKNDAFYVEQYRKKSGHGSIVVMCLSETNPTYHHWKLFTHGASGAALYFKREEFGHWLLHERKLKGKLVRYCTEDELRQTPPTLAELPFVKRSAYEAEAEFRLLLPCTQPNIKAETLTFPLGMIDQVVLNPWMPRSTFDSVKRVIRSIDGCSTLAVRRAAMVESDRWKELALDIQA